MSPIFLLIVIFAVLGVASLGVLSTEIMINAQNLKVLPSITDIAGDPDDLTDGTFFCTCQNPSNPNESGPQFCLFGAGQPYEDSEMICTWEAAEDYYGGGDLYGEGCSIKFWKKHIGFDPKKYYISTDGEIIKTKKCYRCGGVANSIRGIKYDRFKESLGWINRPICWSCYMRKYPYKAKKEIMKNER